MSAKSDISLMVKVARMYYINGLKQEEIAKQLQISRSMISMILTKAKEEGIVEINVRNPLTVNEEVSKSLKSLFGLRECIVIPTAIQDFDTLRKLVAQRAATIFNDEINDNHTIGMAWGRTCHQFVSVLEAPKNLTGISVVSLIGGSNQTAVYFQLNEMVRLLSEKLHGSPFFIHAPVITSSNEEKKLYMNSSSMQLIKSKWENMDLVISGIGTLPSLDNKEREVYTGEYEIYEQLAKNKAVGDICARYFNIKGEFIDSDYYHRVIGIPIDYLKSAKKLICIASGKEKKHSILGALRTGMVDVFITDEQTAAAVLEANAIE